MVPPRSPLTGSSNVELLATIDAEEVVRNYERQFGIDVSPIFGNIPRFFFCLCKEFKWYYLPWKWEHSESLKSIKDGDAILEIGAAKGDFLKRLQTFRKVKCTGLELNAEAAKIASLEGQQVLSESIEDHALTHAGGYDVVCSYQVLEHIPDIKPFLTAMVECIKPGGILIVSVPNNDSFMRNVTTPSKILNMPPHHMGHWTEASLRYLEKIVPVTWQSTSIEPLQPIHTDTYLHTQLMRVLKSDFLIRAFWKLRLHLILRPLARLFSRYIVGHSILVVFRKNG
jgi:2-polyprenyl-3-methyl-5-hydroxy-6-metoxy-1,4-benzoquinol methylase